MRKVFVNNLLITLIFFILFEIFLRTFNLADLRGHGKELKEKQTNTETLVFGKKVYLNKYGYRIPYKKFNYKNNLKKIIFIGDSVLFGSGVDSSETFVDKLRKNNQKKSYINAAIIGNDISENLSDISKNHQIFDSNTFFLVFTLDDIKNDKVKNNHNSEKTTNVSFIEKIKKNYFLSKINIFLRTKSYTYLWVKGIITKPSERYFFESFNSYKESKKIDFLIKKFDEIKFLEESENLNIKIIILPYEFQTRNNCNNELLSPQKIIIEIFNQKKINFLDLTSIFCNYSNPKKLYLNFDPVHLSEEGHELVYNSIKSFID